MILKFSLIALLTGFSAKVISQTTVTGIVTDEQTRSAIAGATISLKGSTEMSITDHSGQFRITTSSERNAVLIVSHTGFLTSELDISDSLSRPVSLNVVLRPDGRTGNAVIITATRRNERIIDAPASIHILSLRQLGQFAGSNVFEKMALIQGIEYTRNGVDEVNINARGFNSAFNNKVFQLVDGRNSMSALSASLPVMNRGTTNKDDIEKIEIILGPQSALYGPNAHNLLLNTITKDPRKYPGTTVSVSAGSQNQFSSRIRQATKINNRWAYKLTGEYAVGKEFNFYDSVYAGNQSPGFQPFFGPAVVIPERNVDFNFRHLRGEAGIYYDIDQKTDIVVSGGSSTNDWVQVTTTGRNQMKGVTYSFLQARVQHPRFFVNISNTWGLLGRSYVIANYTRDYWNITHSSLNTGPNRRLTPDSAEIYALRNRFKEESSRLNAEFQYNYPFKRAGLFLIAGINYQKENPNGYGVTLIDSFSRIRIAQYGGVLQLDKSLPWKLRVITTNRLDKHDNFGTFFSPRVALLKGIGEGNFRITWGRAFAMPSIQNQYAGIGRILFGNGAGIRYIRTNTKFSEEASRSFTIPLQPEQVSTWEVGYKSILFKKLFIDISYFNSTSKNFISPARTIAGRVESVNGIPVTHNPVSAGAIINDTLRNATFSTFLNYGKVKANGLDAGLHYSINKFFNLAVRYSYFASDITKDKAENDANLDGYVSLEERSMNAPRNRGTIILDVQDMFKKKLNLTFSVRYVEQYDFYSASQIGTAAGRGFRGKVYSGMVAGQPRYYLKNFDWGPLGDFTTVDAGASYKLNEAVRLNASVSNIFNTRQIEFVGSPSVGRLFMFEMKIHLQ